MGRLFFAATIGFLLGIRHAIDPDHLVAMSTMVTRSKRFGASWLLGACWGIGHTLTIFAVGLLIIGLKVMIPPRIGAGMEFSVGIMLCILGAMNLAGYGLGSIGIREHSHEHHHDESHHHHMGEVERPHAHLHVHSALIEGLVQSAGKFQMWRSFGVGLVHGLAGSSAVALMVLAAIPGFRAEIAYLLIFGLGTLVGMMGLSAAMEAAVFLAARKLDLQRFAAAASGWMSLGFGFYIMYTIGFVGYTPH